MRSCRSQTGTSSARGAQVLGCCGSMTRFQSRTSSKRERRAAKPGMSVSPGVTSAVTAWLLVSRMRRPAGGKEPASMPAASVAAP